MSSTINTLAQRPDNFVIPLQSLGTVQFTGDDAQSYLQGQVTLDVSALEQGVAKPGCHCDFKGKTWNIFQALKLPQGYLLISHKEGIPPSLAEYKKYGVFANVEIADTTDDWHFFGAAGEEVEAALLELFGELPEQPFGYTANDKGLLIRQPGADARYLVLSPAANDASLKALAGQYPGDEAVWEALDIAAGLANIQQATSNQFVPQMMNMQALDAISFNKGCYMGQEVVARTRYLGKNKRAAYILTSDQAWKANPGDTLEVKLGENWRRVGTLLRSAALGQQSWLLTVMANDSDATAEYRLKQYPESRFTLESLPYPLAQ